MSDSIKRIKTELGRWSKGVLNLNPPASTADLNALARAIRRPLPEDYVALLQHCDGADLRGDRLLSAAEALERWQTLRTLIAHTFREDVDWDSSEPPDHLLPIACDLDGNLKCLDLLTAGPEVVDWYRESGAFTTWHYSVVQWLITCLKTLEIRFDHRGRPRPIRSGEADLIRGREIQAHLSEDPQGAYPRLQLAELLAESSTPEEALIAFRQASDGVPQTAINHFLHARFAIVTGRHEEARRQLRRCLAVPPEPNPRKHEFRSAYLPAAHELLARLYERVGGQQRKADEHHRHSERAASKYGYEGYDESPEYHELLHQIDGRKTP